MDTAIAAIIGGIFSLGGIWLAHSLNQRGRRPSTAQPAAPPSQLEPSLDHDPTAVDLHAATSPPVAKQWFKSKTKLRQGCFWLAADLVIILLVVSEFALDKTEPWWESYFTLLVMGVIPMYALYLIFFARTSTP
jgi:hypothetical protein